MMGQQTMAEQVEGTLRRIFLVLAAAALMAMITMATALTAVATLNSGSAAGQCGHPGQASVTPGYLPAVFPDRRSSRIARQAISLRVAAGRKEVFFAPAATRSIPCATKGSPTNLEK